MSSKDHQLHMLMEVVGTLKDSQSIISRNRKLVTSISLAIILANSLLYLINVFSVKPLINDMLMDKNFLISSPPGSMDYAKLLIDIQKIAGSILSLQSIFLLLNYTTSIFLNTATILATTLVPSGQKDLPSFKYLFSMAIRSWKRPFLTSIYIALLSLGYLVLVPPIVLSVLLFSNPAASPYPFITTTILASVCYTFFSTVWTLGFVVSVLEEVHGIEALGKAAQLIKGLKIEGFLLNLCFQLVLIIVLVVWRFVYTMRYSITMALVVGLLGRVFMDLFGMFWLISYSVFYHKCKKSKGEEVVEFFQGTNIDQHTKLNRGFSKRGV